MINLEDIMEQRSEAILLAGIGLNTECEIMEDSDWDTDWGVIAILNENDEVTHYEFVESEVSWMRPEAVDEYNEAADLGTQVIVVVPDEALLTMNRVVRKYGNQDVIVCCHSDLGLTVRGVG